MEVQLFSLRDNSNNDKNNNIYIKNIPFEETED